MKFKAISGFIGLVAMLAFLAVPVIKLHPIPLIIVALIGAGLAISEYIESLREDNKKEVEQGKDTTAKARAFLGKHRKGD